LILVIIIESLQKNNLPTQEKALKFFNFAKSWIEKDPGSAQRRAIFTKGISTYKKWCQSTDRAKVQNEIGAAISAIQAVWKTHEAVILSKVLPLKTKAKRNPVETELSFLKEEFAGLTWINH
jgi:hypothetical protein